MNVRVLLVPLSSVLCLNVNSYARQRSFNNKQYKQIDDTIDWVVKARHLEGGIYEIVRLAKPDTLWDLEQALRRKGVEGADRISYLVEKKRVDFVTSKTQLLELRWYDKDGHELHRDIVDQPKWENEERHVGLLRRAFKQKRKRATLIHEWTGATRNTIGIVEPYIDYGAEHGRAAEAAKRVSHG